MLKKYRTGVCRHCKRPSQSLVGRGLCITCHRKPDVRARYPHRNGRVSGPTKGAGP